MKDLYVYSSLESAEEVAKVSAEILVLLRDVDIDILSLTKEKFGCESWEIIRAIGELFDHHVQGTHNDRMDDIGQLAFYGFLLAKLAGETTAKTTAVWKSLGWNQTLPDNASFVAKTSDVTIDTDGDWIKKDAAATINLPTYNDCLHKLIGTKRVFIEFDVYDWDTKEKMFYVYDWETKEKMPRKQVRAIMLGLVEIETSSLWKKIILEVVLIPKNNTTEKLFLADPNPDIKYLDL